MIILTGPQSTDDERGFLEEMAAFFDAKLTCGCSVEWAAVTDLYCLPGWEGCSTAVADVSIAEAFGLLIRYIVL
ncbi:hypothetical protein [Streptomyces sp. NPDC005302]|uniref:hypothetical protein n=1 Tax=Streptomyces sp. NPDC005302 TaxID=3154675 RepID=UPI0033BCCB9F